MPQSLLLGEPRLKQEVIRLSLTVPTVCFLFRFAWSVLNSIKDGHRPRKERKGGKGGLNWKILKYLQGSEGGRNCKCLPRVHVHVWELKMKFQYWGRQCVCVYVGEHHQGLTRKTETPSCISSEWNLMQGVVYVGDRGAENQTGAGEVTQKLERAGNHYTLRVEKKWGMVLLQFVGWDQQKEGGIRVGLFARTDSLRKHSHLFLKRTLKVKWHEENYPGFPPSPLLVPI